METPRVQQLLAALAADREALHSLGVERIGIFGSVVRGEETHQSDLDVLVDFTAGQKSLSKLIELGEHLERLTGRHVDLVTRESLSPYIGPHILREVQYAEIAA
jgi:predicted nucleotidyltransferase